MTFAVHHTAQYQPGTECQAQCLDFLFDAFGSIGYWWRVEDTLTFPNLWRQGHKVYSDSFGNHSLNSRRSVLDIETLREVGLDEMPLCVLPSRERLSDTGKSVTEPNIPLLSAGIAEFRKPPVLFGFQKGSLRCSHVLIHCSIA